MFQTLRVQNAISIRHTVIRDLTDSTIYFPHCLTNGTIFGKRFWTPNVCFDFLYNVCQKHISFKKNWAIYYQKYYWSSYQSNRYPCQILVNSDFPDRFSKNTYTSNLMKILPLGAALCHVTGRKDGHISMQKLRVAFRHFANAPKNCAWYKEES